MLAQLYNYRPILATFLPLISVIYNYFTIQAIFHATFWLLIGIINLDVHCGTGNRAPNVGDEIRCDVVCS